MQRMSKENPLELGRIALFEAIQHQGKEWDGDRELARRYELVRKELTETIRLNETLGAPSARAMEKLFAAIDAEEARVPRRRRRPISRTRFLTPARDSTRQKPSLTK
jgi:hypothetical protein